MKKLITIAAMTLLVVSCGKERFAGVNTDPTAVSKPDPSFLFLKAQNSLRGSEYTILFYTANRCAYPWGQITVGDRGSLNVASMFDVSRWDNPCWGNLYGDLGGTVKELQDVINNMDEKAKGTYQNLYHMSQVMIVQAAIYASDYNGDIPYSEALKGLYTNPPLLTPIYDTQEALFDQLDTELKAAIAVLGNEELMKTQVTIKKEQEPVYKSDYKKWVKYANALRLKIALRLIHANPTKAKAIAQEVANSGLYMQSNDDDYRIVTSKWDNGPGNGVWSGTAADSFTDLLKDNRDPRVRFFFSKNPYSPGVVQGMLDQGLTFPSYIAEQMVVTGGKFIRWKSAKMGDGDEFLGEPWVRYQGIPVKMSTEFAPGEEEDYTIAAKFQVTIGTDKRAFMPYSGVSKQLLGPADNDIYPSMSPVQDDYKPNNAYNYTLVLVSAAETNYILALFASQGVNVPGKSAAQLYQDGIRFSVNAYDKTAQLHNFMYYENIYDDTKFVNKDGKEEIIEKPIKLAEGEIEAMLTYPLNTLTGDAKSDVEKCFIQLVINSFQYPADIYTYIKFGGIPMYGSDVWPRQQFVKNLDVDKNINIPRHLKFNEPDKSSMNYNHQLEAYTRQGFVDYTSASPDMNERMWNDKNSPAWGAGPIVR